MATGTIKNAEYYQSGESVTFPRETVIYGYGGGQQCFATLYLPKKIPDGMTVASYNISLNAVGYTPTSISSVGVKGLNAVSIGFKISQNVATNTIVLTEVAANSVITFS